METWDFCWGGYNFIFTNQSIMALTSSEVKEIEVMIRKEIKSFMNNNTVKQFEDQLMDRIQKEIQRGKLEGEVKEITLKMFREFYQFMWVNRSYWEPRLKNA